MDVSAFVWIDLIAAAALALWIVARYPNVGPKSLGSALVAFLVGQLIPSLGLVVVQPVVRLPHGIELALLGVALPMFVVMFLTTMWLMRASMGLVGGPRGGQRIRRLSRSRV